MRFRSFEWDEYNTDHIARHNVTPEEAEEVCENDPFVRKARNSRYIVLGQTEAGRYLTVIITINWHGLVRAISARDMDDRERRQFARR